MKTSTKLIIILFTCIPVSLLAYNLLLKTEYSKGNFYRDLYPQDNSVFVVKPVSPGFKHIVIDGSLKMNRPGNFELWMAHIWIGKNTKAPHPGGNTVTVNDALKETLETLVKNDTLFITFRVKGKFDNNARSWNDEGDIVKIFANNVQSVDIKYAFVTVTGNLNSADSLKLRVADGSHYDVNNLSVKSLDVTAADSSYVNVTKSNRINMLNYSLRGKSSLMVNENPARQFHAGQVDSTANIQLTGKATYMQTHLH
jgi:hypothetical protein